MTFAVWVGFNPLGSFYSVSSFTFLLVFSGLSTLTALAIVGGFDNLGAFGYNL
jgi:hypothetical protein